jgi:hypothetical protein
VISSNPFRANQASRVQQHIGGFCSASLWEKANPINCSYRIRYEYFRIRGLKPIHANTAITSAPAGVITSNRATSPNLPSPTD